MNKFIKKIITLSVILSLPFLGNCFFNAETYTITLANGGTHIVGESTFDINVVTGTGAPAAGLDLTVQAEMDMGSMVHTTPVESITDNGDGSYTVKLYYLMPSSATGLWEILVYVGGDLHTGIPVTVTGSMMDKATLKGVSDKFLQMDMPTNRPYFLFKKSYTAGAGTGSMSVFLATRKSLTEHPALDTNLILVDEQGMQWIAETVSLEIYDASGAWQTMTSEGNGVYSITNANLGGMAQHFRLKVTKVGQNTSIEQKTSDGLTFDGNADPTAKNIDNSWTSNGYGHLMVP